MSSFDEQLERELEKLEKKKKEKQEKRKKASVTTQQTKSNTFGNQLEAELESLKKYGTNTGKDTGKYDDYSVVTTDASSKDIAPVKKTNVTDSVFDIAKNQQKYNQMSGVLGQASEISKKILAIDNRPKYGAAAQDDVRWNNERASLQKELDSLVSGYGGLDKLRTQTQTLNQQLKLANYQQKGSKLASVMDANSASYDKDFSKFAKEDKSVNDDLYAFVNNRGDAQAVKFNPAQHYNNAQPMQTTPYGARASAPVVPETNTEEGRNRYAGKGYHLLTEEEKSIFNYYWAKEGKEKAVEWLDSIQWTLNERMANQNVENIGDSVTQKLLFGAQAGFDQFSTGLDSAANALRGKDEFTVPNVKQITSSLLREDLTGVGRVAYDLTTTTANMLPSILASTAANFIVPGSGAVVGAATLGTSAGGNAYQEMINQGYDASQAKAYGLLVGGSEAVLQSVLGGITKLSGGSGGVFENLIGKALPSVENGLARFALKYGGNMLDEGLEEAVQEVLDPIFQRMVGNPDAEVDWGEVAYSALLGAMSAGVLESSSVPGAVKAYKNGVDPVTGLTKQEQSVKDKLIELETEGKTLTKKETAEIEAKVLEDMENGLVPTEIIEEVLGGENYTAYQDMVKQDNEALAELAELYEGDELKQRAEEFINNSKRHELAKTLSDSVYDMVKDTRLGESYRDRARRGQLFQADTTQYDEKQQVTIQRAIDSGVLNNTKRTHDMVDFIARVSADTGVLFDFTNNEKLKDSIFAVNGKTVDGYITKDGITINVNSPRYINTIVGHEITHAFEGSEQYDVLEKAMFEYAKEKGTYKDVLKDAYEMYRGEEGYQGYEGLKKIKKEAVANLVGDYLFTDKNFVNHLSANHQNIFQKAWNEVKYMVKIARAGSNEAKKLLEVQKAFEDAYRGGTAQKNATVDSGVRLSISKTSKIPYGNQLEQIEKGKMNGSNSLYIGKPSEQLKTVGFSDAPFAMNQSDYRKSRRKSGNNKHYSSHSVPYSFFENMPQHLADAPMVIDNGVKASVITSFGMKDTKGNDSYVIAGVWTNQQMESDTVNLVKSAYPLDDIAQRITKAAEDGRLVVTNKNKAEQMLATIGIQPAEVSRILNLAKGSISQQEGTVNKKYSLSKDSDGKQLTKEQQDFFKDSKVRDTDGNLLVLYHGTPNGKTTVFDPSKTSKINDMGQGIYFSTDNHDASSYMGKSRNKKLFSAYVNIKNPFVISDDKKISVGDALKLLRLCDDRTTASDVYNEIRINAKDGYITTAQLANTNISIHMTEMLKKSGIYDGIIDETVSAKFGLANGVKHIIATEPNQIKSIDNTNPTEDPDIRYSLSKDSEGRNLSEQQAKYFEGSKVTDENGNLKVVYHGSPKDFNTFSLEYLGTNGTAEGYGFYFTDKKSIAENYSRGYEGQQNGKPGKLFECYLDIKKPLSDKEVTMTRAQFKKFLTTLNKQVDADGEPLDVLSNYGDVDWEGLNKVLSYAMEIEYDGSDSDVNLVHSIINGCGNMEVVLDVLRKTLGYDGIIVNEATWGGDQTIYIAFHPEQIKNIDNLSPTTDPDIRHSLSNDDTHPIKQGNWHISGKDIAYEDIAPVTVSKTESVVPVEAVSKTETTTEELFPDDREELTNLLSHQFELRGALESAVSMGDTNTMSMLTQEYESVTARIRELEAQESERFDSLDDADAPMDMDTQHDEVADTTPLNKKTVTDLSKKVKSLLGVKNNRTGEVVSMIEAYSRSDNPSSEKLFEELKEKFGKYTDKSVDDATREVKALLRGYKINVSDSIKSEIADYGDLMRRNFGRVRFSKEGMNVDEVYEDLSAGYPGYFPEDIINPTDQLMQIINVANMEAETVSDMEVDDESLADAARTIARTVRAYKQSQMQELSNREARESFDSLMKSADKYAPADDIAPVKQKEKTSKIEKPAIAPEGKIKTVKERLTAKMQDLETELANNRKLRVESWTDYDNEIARAKAEYNAKGNKNTVAANDLLRRIERLNRMKHNTDADYAKRISDLEARTAKVAEEVRTGQSTSEQGAMRQELHNRILSNIRSEFENNGFSLETVLGNAKDLSTFATVDNTPQRVMEKALGYKAGGILADLTVNKVAQNETEGIKWLNAFTDRKNGVLAQISKQYHIKPGSKESAAAQMYAEGFYVTGTDKNGEWSEGKSEIVPYGDAELAQDFPNAKVRENIKGLARDPRIRQIYDSTLAMINASRARNAYPEIQRLDNYFLHFRAMDDAFSRLGIPFNPKDIKAKDLPTDLNGVTADLKPGQPYFASAMHREGKRTSFDLLGGLERYLSSAKNQIYHIDDIQTLRALRNYVADTYGQANGLKDLDLMTEEEAQARIKEVYKSHLSTFAKFLNEEANVIAGKTALIDRGLEGIIGRRGITFFDTVNRQTGSNMVGFNVSSSLTNLLAPVQAFAKMNKFDFVKAFAQTTANKVGSIFGKTDGFAENSPVVIRRKGEERFYRTPWQKASDAGYLLMGAVDDFSTELIARAKYNELTRKGMDSTQAHIEADKWVSRLMGDRSLGQQPQLYNSKMLGMITKFQLEVRNQLDAQFYDTIQETKASNEDIQNGLLRNAKTAAKVGSTFFQLAVAQHLFGKVFESIAGYNPAFDIISAIIKVAGWDDEEDDEDTVLDNIEEGFLELMGDLPYTSTMTGGRIPISSALPVKQFVTGKDQYGNEKSRWETLAEAAPYYILPGGYGQAKKTYQGLDMFSDEHPVAGSYTNSGNLRFPVEDTFGNRVQAGLFGQYASENARYYFDNEIRPLKPNQIQEYIDVDLPIREYWDYREGLSEHPTLDAKGDYIGGLDLPIGKKNILINNIADRETPIDMTDYAKYPNFHEFDWAEQNEEKYAFLQDHGMSYSDYEKLDEDSKDAYTWAFNNPEKYAFIKEQGLSATDYYSLDDDTKDAYGWAYENPEMYTVSKAVSSDFLTYYQYKTDLSKLNAKNEKGESVSGLKKERVIDYINGLDIDYGQKIILFRSMYDGKADQEAYNADIVDYLNSRDDISYSEMVTILKKLGFTVSQNGTVTW